MGPLYDWHRREENDNDAQRDGALPLRHIVSLKLLTVLHAIAGTGL
jgi:hypothetical protein